MRKLTFLFGLIISINAISQTFEIPSKDDPFYDIIEWKGMGAILMSKDPQGVSKQINLTLIGDGTTSIWDQKFNPKNEEFYYLSSENARYVYFLDNLELDDQGKVYFSQLNSAGNIKTTSVALGNTIKKLGGYDFNKLELINAVVTDKALVHHFRYEDKKSKSIREFATFITHHNFLSYAVELGEVPEDNLKDEKYGQFNYIGFTGDEIYFAVRDYQSQKNGWTIKSYTSKGKIIQGTFLEAPSALITIENIGFGTTGKYYLDGENAVENGILSQINGNIYLFGAQRSANSAKLILFKYEEGDWQEINHMDLNYFIEKKALELGVYPMNEGLGYHLDHNGYNKVSLVSFTSNEDHAHNDFSDRTVANPSSVFHPKKKAEFTVTLPGKVLYFDTNQLGNTTVTFELKEQ